MNKKENFEKFFKKDKNGLLRNFDKEIKIVHELLAKDKILINKKKRYMYGELIEYIIPTIPLYFTSDLLRISSRKVVFLLKKYNLFDRLCYHIRVPTSSKSERSGSSSTFSLLSPLGLMRLALEIEKSRAEKTPGVSQEEMEADEELRNFANKKFNLKDYTPLESSELTEEHYLRSDSMAFLSWNSSLKCNKVATVCNNCTCGKSNKNKNKK